ncbi:uncharacterized protein BO96DRAFT_433275 [Aspergillus niger CBS 101883]|uniref:uncharacterized protein n=1 Tax=Aspergillus lacticoffeatus (strain CBS 101883) TaxID=1450533 RepID=UPI000D7FF0C6|nr:uncharacterized protein BO96DRAFT_433275 [Aspergillus niger CBS 101883]PYH57829.1 hypothetical protein BO96DRAFT_433275 [Aspergillus niger CBS 101883]
MAPRVVITFYSMYSYIKRLPDISTCFGNFPVQWKAFWDQTGGIWASGGYWSKYASLFVSTGILGGGQESTVLAAMSTLAYYGFIYISLDYKTIFLLLTNLKEIHGGSVWGISIFSIGFLSSFLLFSRYWGGWLSSV